MDDLCHGYLAVALAFIAFDLVAAATCMLNTCLTLPVTTGVPTRIGSLSLQVIWASCRAVLA
ncbi:MAG: hypothetical protein WBH09_08605 [Rugosibacter sp.]